MAAVRNLHLELGYDYPSGTTTLLSRVMRGIHRLPSGEHTRLPITMPLLRKLCHRVNVPQFRSPHDKAMLHAAITLGFYGFLRCSELVSLTYHDVSISDDASILAVTIRRCKTDQSAKGFTLNIGSSPEKAVCPVQAMRHYLAQVQSTRPNQLFVYGSGSPLAKLDISREIRNLLPLCGVACPEMYASHSLRIGAATTAAIAGVPEHLIRHMGRWKSDAVLKYIRVANTDVSQLSAKLSTIH